MPTSKPRITLTLNRSTYEVITELARLQKRSPGSVVVELLETVEEPLRNLAALLQAANEAPQDFRHKLAGVLMEQSVQIDNQLAATMHDLFSEKDTNPHPYNMGVRSDSGTKPNGKKRGSRS